MRVQGLLAVSAFFVGASLPWMMQAETPPPDAPILIFEVSSPSVAGARLSIRSGEAGSLALTQTERLEILPTVHARTAGVVAVRLQKVDSSGRLPSRIETFDLRQDEAFSSSRLPGFSLQLKEIRPALSQPRDDDGDFEASTIVTLALRLPSQSLATTKIHEGEMLRFGATGNEVGIKARVLGDERVEFQVFRLSDCAPSLPECGPIERFVLQKNAEFVGDSPTSFALSLREISRNPG